MVFQCRGSKANVVCANLGPPSKKKKIALRKHSVGLDFLAVCPLVLCLTGRFSHAYIKVFAE